MTNWNKKFNVKKLSAVLNNTAEAVEKPEIQLIRISGLIIFKEQKNFSLIWLYHTKKNTELQPIVRADGSS